MYLINEQNILQHDCNNQFGYSGKKIAGIKLKRNRLVFINRFHEWGRIKIDGEEINIGGGKHQVNFPDCLCVKSKVSLPQGF